MCIVSSSVPEVERFRANVFLSCRFGGEEQHEENRVHLGNAIMSFYSALIDLLGRCAPEMHVSCLIASISDFSNWLRKIQEYEM